MGFLRGIEMLSCFRVRSGIDFRKGFDKGRQGQQTTHDTLIIAKKSALYQPYAMIE